MCGISGIIGRGWAEAQLAAMVNVQRHRGPDDSGVYVNKDKTVGLGHNRLSIIDLSAAGHQPMKSRDGALWLTYNGEIYNYEELRSELSDYHYQSDTDTEVILAAYEKWGEECVDHFIGMFAFAIWDTRRSKLFCARDRLGIKPFHYARFGESFIFASEIKAILAAGFPARPNISSWSTYLSYGFYDHTDDTFFDEIKSLEPGHILTINGGDIKTRCYWDLPELTAETLEIGDNEAAEKFTRLFSDSVRLRLRSDVPVGVNLSGGLDSASLLVTLDRLIEQKGEVQTFTASFSDSRYDETSFASQIGLHGNWKRNTKRLTENEVWDMAEEAVWFQEAPFGGVGTLAYYNLHKLARDMGVVVLLEGQGVDEMLAGYDYFRPYYYLDLLEKGNTKKLMDEWRAEGKTGDPDLDKIRHMGSGRGDLVYQDGTSHLDPKCILNEVRAMAGEKPQFPKPYGDNLRNALYRDLRFTKLPRVLRMNDHLSMAFGRELREPYLDHRIVEFLFSLPGDQKVRHGKSKHLLRSAMKGKLQESVLSASKRAVVTPQREWLTDGLREQVEEIINSDSFAGRGLFDLKNVHLSYREFCKGKSENSFFVWQWINTELWFRKFIDNDQTNKAASAQIAN